jgi:hypothetical protein
MMVFDNWKSVCPIVYINAFLNKQNDLFKWMDAINQKMQKSKLG